MFENLPSGNSKQEFSEISNRQRIQRVDEDTRERTEHPSGRRTFIAARKWQQEYESDTSQRP